MRWGCLGLLGCTDSVGVGVDFNGVAWVGLSGAFFVACVVWSAKVHVGRSDEKLWCLRVHQRRCHSPILQFGSDYGRQLVEFGSGSEAVYGDHVS